MNYIIKNEAAGVYLGYDTKTNKLITPWVNEGEWQITPASDGYT